MCTALLFRLWRRPPIANAGLGRTELSRSWMIRCSFRRAAGFYQRREIVLHEIDVHGALVQALAQAADRECRVGQDRTVALLDDKVLVPPRRGFLPTPRDSAARNRCARRSCSGFGAGRRSRMPGWAGPNCRAPG